MARELEPYQNIERSIIKKFRKEIWRPFIEAVQRYELVNEGDKIDVCISDVIETPVMSMFYGGQLQAMLPKLHSKNFEGMELIRPMYCIHEDAILDWKRYNNLQFIQCACRFTENCAICDNGGGGSKRQEIKTLIRRLKRDNPNIEKSIFNSIHNVNIDTMPGYKTDGDYHTFLEKFDACMDGEPEE